MHLYPVSHLSDRVTNIQDVGDITNQANIGSAEREHNIGAPWELFLTNKYYLWRLHLFNGLVYFLGDEFVLLYFAARPLAHE